MADERAWRRSHHGARLPGDHRPAGALQAIAGRRRPSRPDPGALPIRRDRHLRQGQPLRRRARPHGSLRGGPHAARAKPQVAGLASLGHEGRQGARHPRREAWRAPASRWPASLLSSCIGCGATRPSSASARSPAPASPRPERGGAQHHASPERVNRIVPVGTMGEAISLRVPNLRAQAHEVVTQIETPRPPDPIMRRPCADREEKRVTRGSDGSGQEPSRSSLTSTTPIREGS